MSVTQLIPTALKALTRDAWLLFVTRFARLFAYGSLSVIWFFICLVWGSRRSRAPSPHADACRDVVVSLLLTTRADRVGRRRMLVIGAILMAAAGLAFASTRNRFFLILAGTIGVISPSGNEVGPFLSIEQAALNSHCSAYSPDGNLRVVHAGGFTGDGAGRAVRRFRHPGAATDFPDNCCELSCRRAGVRRTGDLAGISLHSVVSFGRGGRGSGGHRPCSKCRNCVWNYSVTKCRPENCRVFRS